MNIIWDENGIGFRLFSNTHRTLFEFSPGLGLSFTVELPSDWHEEQSIHISWCLIWGRFHVLIPCWRRWPDYDQCAGPTYGFRFFEDILLLFYGNSDGTPEGDRVAVINMPWQWRHVERRVLGGVEDHSYRYRLRNGEVQERVASIHPEEREWWRPWSPSRQVIKYIDISFDEEVGERTGSYKGGVLGCGYNMLSGERPVDTLRRMERDRRFE